MQLSDLAEEVVVAYVCRDCLPGDSDPTSLSLATPAVQESASLAG